MYSVSRTPAKEKDLYWIFFEYDFWIHDIGFCEIKGWISLVSWIFLGPLCVFFFVFWTASIVFSVDDVLLGFCYLLFGDSGSLDFQRS